MLVRRNVALLYLKALITRKIRCIEVRLTGSDGIESTKTVCYMEALLYRSLPVQLDTNVIGMCISWKLFPPVWRRIVCGTHQVW